MNESTSDYIRGLIKERDRLEAERDRAREDCGFQKGLKESLRNELSIFIKLKREETARADQLEAELECLKGALADAWDAGAESAYEWQSGITDKPDNPWRAEP